MATQMGEPVYAKLGFEIEGEQLFFKGEVINSEAGLVIPYDEKYKASLFALDYAAYGETRQHRLEEHLSDTRIFVVNNMLEGFYMPTLGDGLVVADNSKAGIELMKERLKTRPFAILPSENTAAIDFLKANGFNNFRNAKRMRLGEARSWNPLKIYNRVNGQIG